MSEGDGGGQGQVSETDTAYSTSQLIPVLVQVKTSKTLDQGTVNNAFYTLDLNKLFQHKSTLTPTEVAGANSLRELACNGCIKLVVSTDFVNLEQQLCNFYLREEACSSQASIKRGEKKDLGTKALLGVIGKDNILAFVDSWLFEAMFVPKDAI
ncbi:hypothetical protein SELMODRAFT_406119 [Selaginella moellendorffii]|uniref:Uncharacterized protein n=1 Tax=Selaginella moellendorffii TaxID=88036 RepID=D8R0R9_SELML|nr:uncharacterized protein LOC9655003 [Selaginella moellendorffii]EFJ35021.1 hypothetical protein SELMODRAFT_406119 [Selaginella moellendorffii]|eukprot:XP_002964688.1 uncharacterized protein LOC9655003 [Selaginella moellendorffii]